jgi:hypothetical protein
MTVGAALWPAAAYTQPPSRQPFALSRAIFVSGITQHFAVTGNAIRHPLQRAILRLRRAGAVDRDDGARHHLLEAKRDQSRLGCSVRSPWRQRGRWCTRRRRMSGMAPA